MDSDEEQFVDDVESIQNYAGYEQLMLLAEAAQQQQQGHEEEEEQEEQLQEEHEEEEERKEQEEEQQDHRKNLEEEDYQDQDLQQQQQQEEEEEEEKEGQEPPPKRKRNRGMFQKKKKEVGPPPEFDFVGSKQIQQRKQEDTEYDAHGFEFKRRRLLTLERNASFLPVQDTIERVNAMNTKTMKRVDFSKLAANCTKLGKRLLFEKLSTAQMDEWVGLATTLKVEEEEQNNPALPLPPLGDIDFETYHQAKETSSAYRRIETVNPLLSTIDSPPPPTPSFVKYIQTRAARQVFGGNDDTSNERSSSSTAAAAAANNPPISSSPQQHLKSCFGTSAAVAIGMAVEEAVAASLLPLAGLHVLRCRAMEDMVGESNDNNYSLKRTAIHPITGEEVQLDMDQIDWKNETSFQEWTLPPEEAIGKLLDQGLISDDTNHFLEEPSRQYSTTTQQATASTPSRIRKPKQTEKEYFDFLGQAPQSECQRLCTEQRSIEDFPTSSQWRQQ